MRTKAAGEAALLLLDAVAVLREEKVDYAVIGAMAASVHGIVRATVDADAVLSVTAPQLGGLESKFKAAGFSTELRRGDLEDPIAALLQLTDSYGNMVDLLAGLRGLESAAFSRAVDIPFEGEVLRVIGAEDFIAMKIFAGGPQDMADARNAISGMTDSLDLTLLRRLARRYGRPTSQSLDTLLPPG